MQTLRGHQGSWYFLKLILKCVQKTGFIMPDHIINLDLRTFVCNFHSSITDIDECELGISGCQHICNNTVGSFYCSCDPGFTLNPDSKYCTGEC